MIGDRFILIVSSIGNFFIRPCRGGDIQRRIDAALSPARWISGRDLDGEVFRLYQVTHVVERDGTGDASEGLNAPDSLADIDPMGPFPVGFLDGRLDGLQGDGRAVVGLSRKGLRMESEGVFEIRDEFRRVGIDFSWTADGREVGADTLQERGAGDFGRIGGIETVIGKTQSLEGLRPGLFEEHRGLIEHASEEEAIWPRGHHSGEDGIEISLLFRAEDSQDFDTFDFAFPFEALGHALAIVGPVVEDIDALDALALRELGGRDALHIVPAAEPVHFQIASRSDPGIGVGRRDIAEVRVMVFLGGRNLHTGVVVSDHRENGGIRGDGLRVGDAGIRIGLVIEGCQLDRIAELLERAGKLLHSKQGTVLDVLSHH